MDLTNLAIPLAAIAAIGWIITTIRNLMLGERLTQTTIAHADAVEKLKAAHAAEIEQLAQTHAGEIEHLRTALILRVVERESVSSHARAQQAEVLSELYRRLVRAQRALDPANTVSHSTLQAPRDEPRAAECANAFLEYFDENRVWLDESLISQVLEFEAKLRHAWACLLVWSSADGSAESPGLGQKAPLAWRSAWYTVVDEIPALRRQIEQHMREILGVPPPPSVPEPTLALPPKAIP